MAELDTEMLERVARWCAEAGRQAGAGEIRAALGALGWDELLAVRALLADPPPARPLGPFALADLARGAPPDVAAEREREGRYRYEPDATEAAPAPPPAGERVRGPRKKTVRRPAEIVVHRARDRAATAPATEAPPPLPALSALVDPSGRAVLERLVRRHGARRGPILAELAAGWRRDEGGPPQDEDLAALLEEHGLARAFERRERDELLHAVRAAGGVRARAAAALGLAPETLDVAVARLGAEEEVERIREDRRHELRGRATLTGRVHLLVEDPERLADLGVLAEIEADLAARLPEHIRALRAGSEPVRDAFGRSLSLGPDAVSALEARFGLDLGPGAGGAAERIGAPAGTRPDRPRAFDPRRTSSGSPDRRRDRPDRRRPERGTESPRGDRPRGARPERPRTDRQDRPRFGGPGRAQPGAAAPEGGGRRGGSRADRPRFDRPERPRFDRPDRPRFDRPERPRFDRPDRPRSDRPERPRFDRRDRPRSDRPDRPRSDRPERPRSGAATAGGGPRADRPRSDRSGPSRRPGAPTAATQGGMSPPTRRGPGGGRARPGGGSGGPRRPGGGGRPRPGGRRPPR